MAPRLRDDLVAATVEEDGVVYVDLTDPATGVSFRFYDFEYELAMQLTGQPVDDVVAWASVTYELDLTAAALDEFVDKLAGLGFLAGVGVGAQPTEISPSSPSSGSAPFSAPIPIPEEPEIVELASAPMFGEGSAGLAVPAAEAPIGTGSTRATPAAASSSAPPAATSPPRSSGREGSREGGQEGGQEGVPDFRPREAPGTAGRSRTLPGIINLAPLTPMTSPLSPSEGGHAAPPVLPRLQSLGSPLPPLAADALIGGGEIKRAPPRPVLEAPPAAVAPPIAPFPLAATPAPQFSKTPLGSPGSLQARAATPPPAAQPSTRAAAPSPASSPRSPTPPAEETPFTSIAHAIVSELERPSGTPAEVGTGGALEPPSGLVVAPSRAGGTPATGPGTAAPVSAAPLSPTPVVRAPIAATPIPAAPIASAPSAPVATPVAPASSIQVTPSTSSEASVPAGKPTSVTAGAPASDPPAAVAGWTSTLTDEVEKPLAERRQAPGPNVVVMPPVEPAALPPAPKRRAPLLVGAVMLAAVVAAAVYALRDQPHSPPPAPAAPSVHVTVPQPTTVYEWFAASGTVIAGHDDELAFKVAGKLQDVMPPGTTFSSGDAVAHLQGAAVRELNVNRIRSRVAFFEQLRDSSRAAGNESAARQAEANLAARKRELADAQTRLADLEIRPAVAGTIGQVLVDRGAFVKAGVPVFRIRAAGPRATFALGAAEQAKARTLGFCRLETLPGAGTPTPPPPAAADAAASPTPPDKAVRTLDCALPPVATPGATAGPGGALAVDLGAASGVAPGTAVRLASARFDGVFPVPRSAIVHDVAGQPPGDRVWVVSAATQVAESRAVELAPASSPEPAFVTRGLATGDAVVVDPSPDLVVGGQVNVVH